LAFCHAHYAFDKKLTETRIKLIDYMYLGVVVIGVLLFAYAYGDQRRVATLEFQKAVELPMGVALQAVHSDFLRLAQLCGGPRIPIAQVICKDSHDLDVSLAENRTGDQLANEWNTLRDLIDVLPSALGGQGDEARQVVERIKENLGGYLGLKKLDEMLGTRNQLKDRLVPSDLETTLLRMFETGTRTMGQFVVWPLLLLLALALRITKVTIEILCWGQQPAVPDR